MAYTTPWTTLKLSEHFHKFSHTYNVQTIPDILRTSASVMNPMAVIISDFLSITGTIPDILRSFAKIKNLLVIPISVVERIDFLILDPKLHNHS